MIKILKILKWKPPKKIRINYNEKKDITNINKKKEIRYIKIKRIVFEKKKIIFSNKYNNKIKSKIILLFFLCFALISFQVISNQQLETSKNIISFSNDPIPSK